MRNRLGFTMLELIFVIVIMGILGKFGVEFLFQAYNNFIYSNINNTLQAQSATAVESIATRLQFRIKDSLIARELDDTFTGLSGYNSETATVLEWVGTDIDGFRGNSLPFWSGIIDLDDSTSLILKSPETNTTALNNLIKILSHNSGTDINNTAIYFIGSNSNVKTSYGWSGNTAYLQDQNGSIHPINSVVGQINQFAPKTGSFSGFDIYEYYQLAWSAYAVVHSTDGNLTLHYDYQPWEGENYTNAKAALIMENVDTFRFKAVGSVVKIQVCVKTDLMEDYSLCKEKTIF